MANEAKQQPQHQAQQGVKHNPPLATATPPPEPEKKDRKRLDKEIQGHKVIIAVVGGEKGKVEYDFDSLPVEIKDKFGPFGLASKLGDAAAGRSGKDAEEAINKVWEGLKKNDWSVRAPAQPKVTGKELADNISKLPEEMQAKAREVLKALGIKLP